jgi:hypothetical protein
MTSPAPSLLCQETGDLYGEGMTLNLRYELPKAADQRGG